MPDELVKDIARYWLEVGIANGEKGIVNLKEIKREFPQASLGVIREAWQYAVDEAMLELPKKK